jgi:hypothetical protein
MIQSPISDIIVVLLSLLIFIPVLIEITNSIRDISSRKKRMRFYDIHHEFILECEKIQDNNVKIKAFEWLLEKLEENLRGEIIIDEFIDDFYEMWGEHIPEYKSKVLSHRRDNKLKDLGI